MFLNLRVDVLAALAPADVDAQHDEYNPELAYLCFDPDAQVEFKSCLP